MDVVPTSGSSHCSDTDWCRDRGRLSTPSFPGKSPFDSKRRLERSALRRRQAQGGLTTRSLLNEREGPIFQSWTTVRCLLEEQPLNPATEANSQRPVSFLQSQRARYQFTVRIHPEATPGFVDR
jgi:hypothetical protein